MNEWVNRRISGNKESKNENINDWCVAMVMVERSTILFVCDHRILQNYSLGSMGAHSNIRFILIGFCFIESRPKQTQTEQKQERIEMITVFIIALFVCYAHLYGRWCILNAIAAIVGFVYILVNAGCACTKLRIYIDIYSVKLSLLLWTGYCQHKDCHFFHFPS